MQRLMVCQTAQEAMESVDLFVDGRVLFIGADPILASDIPHICR